VAVVVVVAWLRMGRTLPAAGAVQVLEAVEHPSLVVVHRDPVAPHNIASTYHNPQAGATQDPHSVAPLAEAVHAQSYTYLLSDTVPFEPSVCRACGPRCDGERGTHPCLAARERAGSDMRLPDYSFLAVSNDDKERLVELEPRQDPLSGKTNTSLLNYICPSPNVGRVYQLWTVLAAALPELRVQDPFEPSDRVTAEDMGVVHTPPRQVLADGQTWAAIDHPDQILAVGID